MRLKFLKGIKRVYFIGIGGISMSALARLLKSFGCSVSGSDGVHSEHTGTLRQEGIKTYVGIEENRLDLLQSDMVVYTDAIPFNHAELQSAFALRKTVYSRMDLLALLCAEFSNVIAIGGSHGKTTCTSMCAHVLKALNLPFTAHIGGEDSTFGNFYTDGKEYFVTEACEYKKNLLKISADRAVVLNIDQDHMECYQNERELMDCFQRYCVNSKVAFVCADDPKCLSLGDFSTFGIDNKLADYRAVDVRAVGEKYAFYVEEYGKLLCRIKLRAIGRCNVYNALAAFSVMRSFGFHERDIARGLESFTAVKRRFERIGLYKGITFVCDYAHHPREIESTVRTARGICKGTLYVVFQPHTYTRTKNLMADFLSTLSMIPNLMIYKTYPAREEYDEEGSAYTLSRLLGDSLYVDNVFALKTWLDATVKEGDTVLFLGAGDIYYVAQHLLKAF